MRPLLPRREKKNAKTNVFILAFILMRAATLAVCMYACTTSLIVLVNLANGVNFISDTIHVKSFVYYKAAV